MSNHAIVPPSTKAMMTAPAIIAQYIGSMVQPPYDVAIFHALAIQPADRHEDAAQDDSVSNDVGIY
jgi:hypothetical protein